MEQIKEPVIKRTWHDLYIECQSDPMDSRTDKQFCEEYALDYGTFANWKCKYRKYIFREVEAKRADYKNELRAVMYKALTAKLGKDTNAVKLLAQLLGDLVEKTETKMEMSDADKIRRIESLRKTTGAVQSQWRTAEGSTDDSKTST